jgi:hypothetical protein
MSVSREKMVEDGVLRRVERLEMERSGEAMVRGRDNSAMGKQQASWLSFIPVHRQSFDKTSKSASELQKPWAGSIALRGTERRLYNKFLTPSTVNAVALSVV